MSFLLIYAGFDPTNGAGVSLDTYIARSLGVYPISITTALTVQDDKGVYDVFPIPIDVIKKQMDRFLSFPISAAKVGMLYNKDYLSLIVRFSRKVGAKIFLDPVMYSKNGYPLYKNPKAFMETIRQYVEDIYLFMPNVEEGALFTKIEINNARDVVDCAKRLYDFGFRQVYIKTGALSIGDDLFFDGKEYMWIKGRKIEGKVVHGTGCALSSLIASYYILNGGDVRKAIFSAKKEIEKMIKLAKKITKEGFFLF
jgi:hydroxymethylpyrimidine/phosphomethylpyrimidine kinase